MSSNIESITFVGFNQYDDIKPAVGFVFNPPNDWEDGCSFKSIFEYDPFAP
ncbi:hypothetical protein [Nostoc sp. CCY 9925]|uniref:hypothetical protein n=1 Tax=Nostoc sp. CCY 9925 TaxID=3103865 RepID=UPI0039C6FA35